MPQTIPATKGFSLNLSSNTLEGVWDCSNCGQTRIKGLTKVCTRCNEPRDGVLTPSEKPYLPEDAQVITDPRQLARANAGPEWNCGHCQTANDGNAATCSSCGRPLDFDDTINRTITYDNSATAFDVLPDPRDEILESDLDIAVRTIEGKASTPRKLKNLVLPGKPPSIGSDTKFYEDVKTKSERDEKERQRLSKHPQFVQDLHRIWQHFVKPHSKKLFIVAAVLLIALLSVIIVKVVQYYTATIEGTVTVSERHWQRSIEIERFTTLTNSDWDYPSDGRVTSSERRIRDYETVIDGYRTESYTDYETRYRSSTESYNCGTTDNGNGTFKTLTCSRSVQVPYQDPVQKSRQVPVTHQEPIYGTWYNYQYDRWMTERWVSASDTTSQEVAWPEVSELRQGRSVGSERVGDERRENYEVVYMDSNQKQHSDTIGQDAWGRVNVDDTISARYYQHNGELSSVDWGSVPA